jgi:pimeloyl-ACP methyl ester carboxylesterase
MDVVEGGQMVDERSTSFSVDPDQPPSIVLVHGAPDRARSFTAVVRELGGHGVTTYDRRGYGERAGRPPLPSDDIFEQAEDLIAVIGERPTAVVGHSFGAIVAMAASIKAPRLIAALGLWEPPLVWTSWWPDEQMRVNTEKLVASADLSMLGELYTRTAMGEAAWRALPSARRASYRAEGAALHADMRSILSEPYSLASLTAPILVGCGTGESRGYDQVARRLASYLSAELFEVPGAPHMVHREQPATFARFATSAAALGSPRLSTDGSP